MLKRTQILLGLTIAASIVVSLFLAGCGGHNSTMPSASDNQTLRGGQRPSSPQLRVGVTIWGYRYIGVRSVDPEGDKLKYRIVLEGPVTLVFDQTQGDPFYSLPWNTQPVSEFSSGQWGFVKIYNLPSGSYTIKAQAFDGQNWSLNNQLSVNF